MKRACDFFRAALCCAAWVGAATLVRAETQAPGAVSNPILFVTQFPIPGDFMTIGSVFGNHFADTERVGRGGDLYIRYPDGMLRNLTQEAGFGVASGFQGANSIAVRDPAVHWSGTKAIFSMVVGAPQQWAWPPLYWQLYEVTGLERGATARITKLAKQPENYNNIEPSYASNGEVLFVSDRPRDGARHLYPQLDEYESKPIVTGVWRLDPVGGALTLLQHAPSGSARPFVDRSGRIVFTRWDHLQRDQQNDAPEVWGTFNYSGEGPGTVPTTDRSEVFPESRIASPGLNRFAINLFLPWQINQDGTEEETLNHVGRHELQSYFTRTFTDDANLRDFTFSPTSQPNAKPIENLLQIREDPSEPGRYLGVDAREFETHASGQLIAIRAPQGSDGGETTVEYLTPRVTYCCGENVPENTGHYRNPLPLTDGSLVAVHTAYRGNAQNTGTRPQPRTPYDFRLKLLARSGDSFVPAQTLTPGISKSVSYYDPDVLVSYEGPFWELSPVEVVARPAPPDRVFVLGAPERQAFALENADEHAFRTYLRDRGLGVVVVRNATARDRADKQQPYNLRVPGGVSTTGASGRTYDIAHLQFFQADQIRGLGGTQSPTAGRRALAQVLHDPVAVAANIPSRAGPAGSAPIFEDGSVAMYVPTRRAMTWQTTSPEGTPVVRERYWLTLQPGEIRACDGCHGVNARNQAGQPPATNTPLAFRAMLARWRDGNGDAIFASGFEG